MSLGRDEDAARAFAEAARLTPGVPAVHTSLGVTLAHLHRWHEFNAVGRQEEAIAAYGEAVRVSPGYATAWAISA